MLTIEQRMKVLELAGSDKSCRSIADDFGVGKTQIQSIVKRKAQVLEEFEGNSEKIEKQAMKKVTRGSLAKKKIMFLHSKNKASRKGYKGEC